MTANQSLSDRNKVELGFVLDFNSNPIIFINNNFVIEYTNYKALSFFQKHEAMFKKNWSDFNANQLIGNFSPMLYDVTREQRDNILNLHFGETKEMSIELESLKFCFKFSPIFNLQGERLGTSFELIDMTELINAKKVLNSVIDSAQKGDFSEHKIIQYPEREVIFKDTFYKINQLMYIMDQFMTELQVVIEELSHGNLKTKFSFSDDFSNNPLSLFDLFKIDTNKTIFKLNKVISRLNNHLGTLTDTIHNVWQNNFELVMHLQLENAESNQIFQEITEFLDNLKKNNAEIQQAIEFLDSYSVDQSKNEMKSFSQSLSTSISDVGNSTGRIIHVTHNIQFILNTHLAGLKKGLDLIEGGSIGKGIKLITSEANEIVTKSNQSIAQVKEMLNRINLEFSKTKQSMSNFNMGFDSNLDQMSSFVSVLRSVLGEINQNISGQNTVFDNLANYMKAMKYSKVKTLDTVENTIINTTSMQEIINSANDVIAEFEFDNKNQLELFDDESYIFTIMNCITTVRSDLIDNND